MATEKTRKVLIVCPECNTQKVLPIPESVIQKPDGLTTVQIPAKMICDHSFQIYLDQNFVVRGYNKSDFEVALPKNIDSGIKATKLNYETDVFGFLEQFPQSIAGVMIQALITHAALFVVGIPLEQKEKLEKLFIDLSEGLNEKFFAVSREDYNSYWKTQVFTSKYYDSVVIDANLKVIIKARDFFAKITFGEKLFNDLKKTKSPKIRQVLLTNWFKKFDLWSETLYKYLERNKKAKHKDIVKELSAKKYDEKQIPYSLIIARVVHDYGREYEKYY